MTRIGIDGALALVTGAGSGIGRETALELARRGGPHGVGVTAICPAVTNTPIVTSTRFLGDGTAGEARARSTRLFQRGHPPAKVAAAVVRAIERDRPVVPVGREAWLGWWLHRLLPLRAHQALIARLPLT